jgi:hypothetical protein
LSFEVLDRIKSENLTSEEMYVHSIGHEHFNHVSAPGVFFCLE